MLELCCSELILKEGADELRKEIYIAIDIAVRICQTNQKMKELQRLAVLEQSFCTSGLGVGV